MCPGRNALEKVQLTVDGSGNQTVSRIILSASTTAITRPRRGVSRASNLSLPSEFANDDVSDRYNDYVIFKNVHSRIFFSISRFSLLFSLTVFWYLRMRERSCRGIPRQVMSPPFSRLSRAVGHPGLSWKDFACLTGKISPSQMSTHRP